MALRRHYSTGGLLLKQTARWVTKKDVVFKRSPTGKMIVTKRPDMTGVEWSEAQRAQRGRFALANEYVKAVKADPQAWAVYQKKAKKQNKRARDLAFSDYCNGKDLLSMK